MINMKKRTRKKSLLVMPIMVFVWALGWIFYNLESKNKHKTEKTIGSMKLGKPLIGFRSSLAVEKTARIDPNL